MDLRQTPHRPTELPSFDLLPAQAAAPQSRLRARLRRKVVLTAANLTPTLAANRLARRYLTSGQAILDEMHGKAYPCTILPLGQDAALLRYVGAPNTAAAPRVLIVPGHDGHPRQFARLVQALITRGAAVDTLVLPGHGHRDSPPCTLRHMVTAIRRAHLAQGPYDSLLAHCVTANATLYALRDGITVSRIVFASTPVDLPALVRYGGQQYGLSGSCLDHFTTHVDRLGAPYALDTPWHLIAPTRPEPLLIVHASDDWAAPIHNLAPLATLWPKAQIAAFNHGGHNSLFNVTSAIERMAAFLTVP